MSASKHLYRRNGTGPWWGWCWIVGPDGSRKRIAFSTGQVDKQAAARVVRERERAATGAEGLAADAPGRDLEDALWFLTNEAATKEWSESTRTMHEQKSGHLARLLRECGGCTAGVEDEVAVETCSAQHPSIQLTNLRRHMVTKYIGQRINVEGAARESVRKELSTLRVALTEAADQGWMQEAAAVACIPKFSASSTPRSRWLPPEEYQALLAALPTNRLTPDEVQRRRRWVAVAVYTGAELSVMDRLAWTDVDLVKNTIRLRGTKADARDRTVPLQAGLATELGAVPEAERVGLVVGAWSNVRRDLVQACTRAGIAPVSPHTFRHTFASWLVQKGVPLFVIAKLLGHRSTAMVERHYGHLAPSNFTDAIATLPAFLMPPPPARRVPTGGFEPRVRTLKEKKPRPSAKIEVVDASDRCSTIVATDAETHGAGGANGAPPASRPPARSTDFSTEIAKSFVPRAGVEPATRGFSVRCSTS